MCFARFVDVTFSFCFVLTQRCQTVETMWTVLVVQLRKLALGALLRISALPYPMLSPRTAAVWSSSPLALTISFLVSTTKKIACAV